MSKATVSRPYKRWRATDVLFGLSLVGACGPGGTPMASGGTGTTGATDTDSDSGSSTGTSADTRGGGCPVMVHEGDAEVGSKAELDALDGVTRVTGSLRITATDAFDLAPLRCLEQVNVNFGITDNPELVDISALAKLTVVGEANSGWIRIAGNAKLASLTGLEAIGSLAILEIEDNPALASVDGLSGLGSVATGWLNVVGNPALESLEGFSSLEVVTELYIEGNGLETLGAGSLSQVSSFIVLDNDALVSLGNLAALAEVSSLLVSGNDALKDLSGLALTSAGGVQIEDNEALTSLSGLEDLTTIEGGLILENNPSLASIAALTGLTEIGANLWIRNAGALTSLDGFPAVAQIHSGPASIDPGAPPALRILENPVLVDVSGLSAAGGVQGDAAISDNPMLPSCAAQSALDALTVTGERIVEGNLDDGWPNCP